MIKLKQYLPYIFFFILSMLLIWVFFRGLKVGEFIFSGDQNLRLSGFEEFSNSFFLRKMDNFGVFNSWQQITQFWDSIYYILVFKSNLSLIQVEKLSFFIALFFSFCVSFLGFRKLSQILKIRENLIVLIIITVWYCINPYTLVMWHGGVYNIGFAVTYALSPLILYYFELSIFSDRKLINKMICAVLMFFASFTFWLFAVLVFFLILYYLLSLFIRKKQFKNSFMQVLILVLIFIPLSSFVIFTIVHEFLNNSGDLNSNFIPTFGNQQGGMWYSMLMLFSWGIYTVWTPRTLYPFGSYFLSSEYKTVTLAIYFMILAGIGAIFIEQQRKGEKLMQNIIVFIKNERNRTLFIFILLLIISIFFAKGSQPPFGGVFLFFYNYVPFFSVFRSADHRFGFAIVFCVAILLLYVSKKYKSYFFFLPLVLISISQNYPMYFGNAVRGENVEGKYYDRIIHITTEYQQVADYINQQGDQTAYVLTMPSIEYGNYQLDSEGNEHITGQDLLPKIINMPFVYLSVSSGMDTNSAQQLYKIIKDHDFEGLKKFPIKYIIIRKDIVCKECLTFAQEEYERNFTKLFQNKLFIVYETKDYAPLVNGGHLTFKMINPVEFRINIQNVKDQDKLKLMLSHNKNWKLYLNKVTKEDGCYPSALYKDTIECLQSQQVISVDRVKHFFSKPIFEDSHEKENLYANSWTINTNLIQSNYNSDYYSVNKDGTLDLSFTIFYQPQLFYYLFMVFSLFCVSASVFIVLYKILQQEK